MWGSKGWKSVAVGDEVLDTDEFGFVELEELDGAEYGASFVWYLNLGPCSCVLG